MTKWDIQEIIKDLEHNLDFKRFGHTMGVAHTAACLSMRYEYDMDKAYLAGLLHDCAKYMTHKQRLQYCNDYGIAITDVENVNPALLHAKVGADMCKRRYGIDDDAIYSAVLFHTTGHPNMSMLDKIIYIADYIEPNRFEAPNLNLIRTQAFNNIDTALCTILSDSIHYLKLSQKAVDPMTMQTYLYYVKQE